MSFSFSATDKAELQNFLKLSQRPNVQQYLSQEIARLTAIESTQTSSVSGLNLSAQLSQGKSVKSIKKKQTKTPKAPTKPPSAVPGAKYIVPSSFGWDQKGDWVTVSIRDLPGVGSLDSSKIVCNFTSDSFDLCIHDLDGKNYRVLRDNLDKDIIPDESKLKIKSSKVYIKLKKIPGEYGADHWTELTSKKSKKDKRSAKKKKADPMGGIMDLMKDMYDNGDEKMKGVIGKAMYDSKMGKKGKNINDLDDPTGGLGAGTAFDSMSDMGKMPSFGDDD